MEQEMEEIVSPTKSRKPKNASSRMYVNVNRQKKGYKDKYKIETDKALKKFKADMGKPEDYELTEQEWRRFFRTILIPMDKEREEKMIDMFKSDRGELNNLLILHNAKAGENLAEVYFKKYLKNCPTKWYDLEDFKQLELPEQVFDIRYMVDIEQGEEAIPGQGGDAEPHIVEFTVFHERHGFKGYFGGSPWPGNDVTGMGITVRRRQHSNAN